MQYKQKADQRRCVESLASDYGNAQDNEQQHKIGSDDNHPGFAGKVEPPTQNAMAVATHRLDWEHSPHWVNPTIPVFAAAI
jgi:hypothetical protein